MSGASIRLFQLLKGKLGEEEASELIAFVRTESEEVFESRKETLATRNDLYTVKDELKVVKQELKEEMAGLRIDMTKEIAILRSYFTKSLYFAGVIQSLAIVGSIIGIMAFMGR